MRVSPISNYSTNATTSNKQQKKNPSFGTLVTTKEKIIADLDLEGKKISNHERQIVLNVYDKIKPDMDALDADVQLLFGLIPHRTWGGWGITKIERRLAITVAPERRLRGRTWFSFSDRLKNLDDSSDIARDMIAKAKKYVETYDPNDDFLERCSCLPHTSDEEPFDMDDYYYEAWRD